MYKHDDLKILKKVMNEGNIKTLKKLGIYISFFENYILIRKLPKYIQLKKYSMLLDDIFAKVKKFTSSNIPINNDFFIQISINIILRHSCIDCFNYTQSENLLFNLIDFNMLSNEKKWCTILDSKALQDIIFRK